jgi:hypothetical protein
VNFDPRGANLSLGSVETVVTINVSLHLSFKSLFLKKLILLPCILYFILQ